MQKVPIWASSSGDADDEAPQSAELLEVVSDLVLSAPPELRGEGDLSLPSSLTSDAVAVDERVLVFYSSSSGSPAA